MNVLQQRILGALNDAKMTLVALGRHLGMKPNQVDRELRQALEELQRDRLVALFGNEWTVTKRNAGGPASGGGERSKAPAAEATNGDEDLPDALVDQLSKGEQRRLRAAPPQPKAHGPAFGPASRAILKALASGPMTRKQLVVLLPDFEPRMDNNLWMLKGSGHIVRTGRATYALPGATVADALDVHVADHPVESVEKAIVNGIEYGPEHKDLAEAARALPQTVRISGMPTLDGIYQRQRVGIASSCDLRAELMQTIDLVQDGKVTADQVESILKLARCVVDIDVIAERAEA